jgi:hypothetical protein
MIYFLIIPITNLTGQHAVDHLEIFEYNWSFVVILSKYVPVLAAVVLKPYLKTFFQITPGFKKFPALIGSQTVYRGIFAPDFLTTAFYSGHLKDDLVPKYEGFVTYFPFDPPSRQLNIFNVEIIVGESDGK